MLKHIRGSESSLQAATPAVITSSHVSWKLPTHPVWSDLWHNYWGTNGETLLNTILQRPPLQRFLDILPASALEWLGVPTGTASSSLLVREEMLLFAQRFREARDLVQPIEGVVLLGQSGIGKTALLVFFLLQCLSRSEEVLFTTRYGRTYRFDECGVVAVRPSDFIASKRLPHRADRAPRLWSLVDCPTVLAPPPLSVTLDARPQVFFIAALSPDKLRFKPFEKEPAVRTWWMARWSEEELLAVYVQWQACDSAISWIDIWDTASLQHFAPLQLDIEHKERYRTFDSNAVRSLCAAAGPVPRDILRFLFDASEYNARMSEEMTFYYLPPTISLIVGTEEFSNEACDHVTFVGRSGPLSPTELGDDAFVVNFKTRATAQGVMNKLERFSFKERRALYKRCGFQSHSSWAVRHSGFAGFVFESLARQYTSAALDVEADDEGAAGMPALSGLIDELVGSPLPRGENFHHQFAPMVLAPGSSGSHTTTRFVFLQKDAEARRTTVVVHNSRWITWRLSKDSNRSSLPLSPPGHPSCRPPQVTSEPWAARRIVLFQNVEQLAIDVDMDDVSYYCPSATAYPRAGFDALFFQVVPGLTKVVLWAVQIPSKREDGASDSRDFEMVGRLRDRAQGAWPGVLMEVKYALVVPCDAAMGFNVEWELGDGFGEHEGEVFIQFLDVCGVCKVEDVLGVPVPNPD